MFKQLFICFLILFTSLNLSAQSPTYSRAKILLEDRDIKELSKLGIDFTEGEYRRGYSFTSDFSSDEIELVRQQGFKVEVLIQDVRQHYKDQNKTGNDKSAQTSGAGCGVTERDYPTPVNFSLGSMAGYFTYDEMLALLDSMTSQYPNLITVKQSIGSGTTIEGRDIYYVKISDNANVDEPEPEVLYTALHHAREPGGMSNLIFYMYYLLENYTTDPEIQGLVQNTEMYFIPCVNPDGYIYNETTDPTGGGMWRKNRRDNQDGFFGIDLNRNYGYNWGFDDNGSSPNTFSETYRGTSGFSEPETQLMRDFVNDHEFKLALNYHTYGNLLIYAWGYEQNIYTPDSALFDNYGQLLTKYNGYKFGTANQTVNYVTNGSSDDWMYGEQVSKPKVMAMTPEIGTIASGFWAPSFEIIPNCKSNMFSNLTMAKLASKYGVAHDINDPYLTTLNGYIKFNFQALGLDTSGNFYVSIAPASSTFISAGNPIVYGNLMPLDESVDSIPYTLNPSVVPGDEVKYLIIVNNGLYNIYTDTITKYYGSPSVLFSSTGNNMNVWSAGSLWGTDNSHYLSAPSSISDSPGNPYISFFTNDLILAGQVSLTSSIHALLTFRARWEIETNWDYAQLSISTDNGTSWAPLCGKYTRECVGNPGFGPVYDGFYSAWVREEISLNDYIGQNIKLKFSMISDGQVEHDGFFFDDLKITSINTVGINDISNNIISYLGNAIPNPANDKVNISYNSSNNGFCEFEVYDPVSRKVFSKSLDENKGQINLEVRNWDSGVYFYRITNAKGSSGFRKLVVE